ncbi:transglutaminase family protein [Paenactinomyces guangxiensis]|uniref:Transglutaminase family protein n=1 Tax=Paenactinomyces guangxiensis TaxID=1490290 RepID=A0A7W2A8N6_9BACL|nr:transglutaminase family protein [Paenactinomyces guangxiensis]MBA4494013.1 transglutaminase family protein [Paenactinomyces guangxiensis]MBH8591242.1 transglutaminase family protein [Paenactinomyces guangxiensis]
MHLTCESTKMEDYLCELEEVDYSHPLIQQKVKQIQDSCRTDLDRVKMAYEFVRDHIHHSWDIQSAVVTCKASEVLQHGEGICYAKSHLLAALLRAQRIPAGFCYQRLTLGATPDTGYAVHALNAFYLDSVGKWVRLDARGNKPGVQAEFSIEQEKLAFPVRPELGEMDYPVIYTKPQTASVLKQHTNALEMYQYHLPTEL